MDFIYMHFLLSLVGFITVLTNGAVDPMPPPDGNLHIYHLPIGVGESIIIQCPDGVLGVLDMGTVGEDPRRHWLEPQIRDFLAGNIQNIQNIIITHNHFDHHNLMPVTFFDPAELTGLQNIYVSCTAQNLSPNITDWITDIGAQDKLRTFNGGAQCGPVGGPCGNIAICPNHPEIVHEILGANLGQRCDDGSLRKTRNMDCIVSKITYNTVSMLLPGDFDDLTDDPNEDGPIKWMIDFYGPQLQVTYAHAAHHGDSFACNKQSWVSALMPKFLTSSGDPFHPVYLLPFCEMFDRYISNGSLCKPAVTDPVDPQYCGEHILTSPELSEILQTTYPCMGDGGVLENRTTNEYAIYTTTQDYDIMNLINIGTDGTRFGISFEAVTL